MNKQVLKDKYRRNKYWTDKYRRNKYWTDKYRRNKYWKDKYWNILIFQIQISKDRFITDKYCSNKYCTDQYSSTKYLTYVLKPLENYRKKIFNNNISNKICFTKEIFNKQ